MSAAPARRTYSPPPRRRTPHIGSRGHPASRAFSTRALSAERRRRQRHFAQRGATCSRMPARPCIAVFLSACRPLGVLALLEIPLCRGLACLSRRERVIARRRGGPAATTLISDPDASGQATQRRSASARPWRAICAHASPWSGEPLGGRRPSIDRVSASRRTAPPTRSASPPGPGARPHPVRSDDVLGVVDAVDVEVDPPPRSARCHSSVSRRGSSATIASASAGRSGGRCRRRPGRSGRTTWMPRDPVTIACGPARPHAVARPQLRAAARTSAKETAGGRIEVDDETVGQPRLVRPRDSQMWGVMTFWAAR